MPTNDTITVKELSEALKAANPPFLLDVREPDEFQFCNLGGLLIPLGEITERLDEIPSHRDIVVLCHHGVRSGHASAFLRAQGFVNVRNISGGIDRWSVEIDSAIKRY